MISNGHKTREGNTGARETNRMLTLSRDEGWGREGFYVSII